MEEDERPFSFPQLRLALGQDHVYISAADTGRHYDSEIIIGVFIVQLLAESISAAIKEIGKGAGKTAWAAIVERLHILVGSKSSSSESLAEDVLTADDAVRALARQLSEPGTRAFIEATRKHLEKRLLTDRFPKKRAERISNEFVSILRKRMKHVR